MILAYSFLRFSIKFHLILDFLKLSVHIFSLYFLFSVKKLQFYIIIPSYLYVMNNNSLQGNKQLFLIFLLRLSEKFVSKFVSAEKDRGDRVDLGCFYQVSVFLHQLLLNKAVRAVLFYSATSLSRTSCRHFSIKKGGNDGKTLIKNVYVAGTFLQHT